jgi:hypothetical protein
MRIQRAAETLDGLAHNNRLIFAGALADGRSIHGRDGKYAIWPAPPLYVTDEGFLAIDLNDVAMRAQVGSHALLGRTHSDAEAGVPEAGAIVTGTSAGQWAKLAPGSDGQVLTANSALAAGLEWADPPDERIGGVTVDASTASNCSALTFASDGDLAVEMASTAGPDGSTAVTVTYSLDVSGDGQWVATTNASGSVTIRHVGPAAHEYEWTVAVGDTVRIDDRGHIVCITSGGEDWWANDA